MSSLDKHILKELLLVCSALGSIETSDQDAENEGFQRFVRGENCLEWLQDLQRALRRDDDSSRDICITISSWRVVPQKLIPLILECRDDGPLVRTIFKIYVMLTMPLSKSAADALIKPVNPKVQGDVRDQQTHRRQNALAQQASLHAFKRAFISKEVLSVIVGMLEDPLSHVGVARSEDDNFAIELCLTLLRNVLNIKDPTPGMVVSLGDQYAEMHEQLLVLFQDTLVLDVLLLLAQDVHARENAKLNLLLVEILHGIVRDQEPSAVVAVRRTRDAYKEAVSQPSQPKNSGGILTSVLAKEKTMRGLVASQMHSRHNRFGGALQVGGANGTTTRIIANPFKDIVDCIPQAARKRTKRNKTFVVDDSCGISQGFSESHKATQAREVLYDFSCTFLKAAYDPFMRSIKNEFRIDSSRLQPEDKGMMFRLMFFFMSFHHQLHQASIKDAIEAERKDVKALPKFELGHVLETMDLMSFNLVLREVETSILQKNTKRVGECVSVLKEMMHIVTVLNESSEKAHQMVALGLLTRIFYASEPLDKLFDIVRDWQPGKYSKVFLCHLVELVHTTLKTLEWYKKHGPNHIAGVNMDTTARNGPSKNTYDKEVMDRVNAARSFDLGRYFERLTSNHTLCMYTHLLEYYATNSAKTNHYILAFMMRLSSFKGRESSKRRRGELTEEDGTVSNDCMGLEAMLYNVHTLGVFQRILNDPLTQKPAFRHLVQYVESAVRHFAALGQKNHLVFVEALFQHPNPHAFCETLHSVYEDSGSSYSEPRKRNRERADSDKESETDEDDSYQRAQSAVPSEAPWTSNAEDDGDEEEWSEQNINKDESDGDRHGATNHGTLDGNRGSRSERIKSRSKAGHASKPKAGSDSKKRAPRWTKQEDDYLRKTYPTYASSGSVYALLASDDVLEVNERTEDQIRRRVKKLGLMKAAEETNSNSYSPGHGEGLPKLSGQGSEGVEEKSNLHEEVTMENKPRERRIVRKIQAEADEDSDAMFSSPEDDATNAPGEKLTAPTQRTKRAVLEDSEDE